MSSLRFKEMKEKRRGDSQNGERKGHKKEQSKVLGDDRKEKGRRRMAHLRQSLTVR